MKVTIIGVGNIGGAIARGLVKGEAYNASDITISDLMQKNLDKMKEFDPGFFAFAQTIRWLLKRQMLLLLLLNLGGGECVE